MAVDLPDVVLETAQRAWQAGETETDSEQVIKDTVGNVLQDGIV